MTGKSDFATPSDPKRFHVDRLLKLRLSQLNRILASLVVSREAGALTSVCGDVDYLPFAETLIFICFGLDSSSFAICRVKTPLRYSARMLSELTVFGKEKLRMNEP